MKPFQLINFLFLTLFLDGCRAKLNYWQCLTPQFTLDQIVELKDSLLKAEFKVEIIRPRRWGGEVGFWYSYRDYKSCKGHMYYENGKWDLFPFNEYNCDSMDNKRIIHARYFMTLNHITDLTFYSESNNIIGFPLECVKLPNEIYLEFNNVYKFIYITSYEYWPSEHVSPDHKCFNYRNSDFYLSRY